MKGEYDGYGRVAVFVVTDMKMFVEFQSDCAAKGISLTEGYYSAVVVGSPTNGPGGTPIFPDEPVEKLKLPTDVGGVFIEVQLNQFEDYFSNWHGGWNGLSFTVIKGCVLANGIYCCGDKEKIDQAAKEGKRAKKWEAENGEYDDDIPEHRYCVPDGIEVRDYLLKSELGDLPKVDFELSSFNKRMRKEIEKSDEWANQEKQRVDLGMDVPIKFS